MSKKRPSPDSVLCIDLTEDSDDEQGHRLGDVRKALNPDLKPAGTKRAKIKEERKRKAIAETAKLALQNDGIEVVDATAQPIVPVARMPTPSIDEDIEVVGAKNEVRLPHLRQDCTQFKFQSSYGSHYSRSFLDTNSKTCDLCYCYACDCPVKDCKSWCSPTSEERTLNHCCSSNQVSFWTKERTVIKTTGTGTPSMPSVARAVPLSFNEGWSDDDPFESEYGRYDYDKDDLFESWGFDMIECRKCEHRQPMQTQSNFASGERDFCCKCGRVARVEAFGKSQTKALKIEEGMVLLGTREIKFRIRSHDPRKQARYSSSWDRASWQYSDEDMEEDVSNHLLGSRPHKKNVCNMLRVGNMLPSTHDSDYVVVQSEQDADLLHELMGTSLSDVKASWNKADRQGTFRIDSYLSRQSFTQACSSTRMSFLGLWYGAFPFAVSDLTTHAVSPSPTSLNASLQNSNADVVKSIKSEFSRMTTEYNKAKDKLYLEEQGKLTLLCSSGKSSEGHVCNGDTSFSGFCRRYYSEQSKSWQSKYRAVHHLMDVLKGKRMDKSAEDKVLGAFSGAFHSLCEKPDRPHNCSIGTVMTRLENVGHEAVDFVEGLKVELLGFQRQSLKWALERETMEGGIQRLLWAKLPYDPTRKDKELYYNPILNRFRREPPNLVRGGFIAEEMGLGKTVISLAMILKNPAPVTPVSGSPVLDLEKETVASAWDKGLHKSTPGTNKKRGSILSRGTLVICPVSLVGQWIEEAKSKLEDPGLVYPYHGQSRKRDAKILSKNSIVVTTYQVIASDATHHAKKAGENYCPPLEQVRWWRVICDEGHSLREGQTHRSKAVLSLVADHKWLVSGTPLNTSMKDLTNQFKFLGIEHADQLIRNAGGTAGKRGPEGSPALIQFLLGGIMMRHSQKQKYRGTETTLMSLPKKTERTITISFAGNEKREYEKIEKTAHDFYVDFRKKNGKKITHHYLKLTQKLMPLRVACAGGKYPLPDTVGEKDDENDKKMKKVKFSNFAFKGKLQVLIKELERIRDSDSSSKSLVFSQFGSTLEWLQQELPKHGFQYRTLKGDMTMKQRAKALHDFQSDPPTTIFLLSMRAGAVGINLTQANRVFLMEPCFNPALESQAIGRVHRLGQKREVEIIRLIQKDSVESRLLKFLEKKYESSDEKKTEGASTDDGDSDDDSTSDHKVAAAPSNDGLVGNVSRDKVQIMTDEFDLLFGAEGIVDDDDDDDGENEEQGQEGPAVADMVMSFADGHI